MHIKNITLKGLRKGFSVSWLLSKIIFPVTVIMTILQYTILFDWFIQLATPLTQWIGLPGKSALPLVLGNALNLYAGIGAIISFQFTVKEVFIIAIMLSFSHSLFIESAVAAKAGINFWFISSFRIILAISIALLINLLWPGGENLASYGFASTSKVEFDSWLEVVIYGLKTGGGAVIQLSIIIFPLMIIMQFLRDLGWIYNISNFFEPFTTSLGIRKNASFTLVTGMFLGLTYGAGVMIQAVYEDGVEKKDIILTLIFLVICHSVVEDTIIFIPVGIPVLLLFLFRLCAAIVITFIISKIWDKIESTS